jgi:hypothetical protein
MTGITRNFRRLRCLAITAALACAGQAGAATACSDPSEEWYRDVSDIVFDGTARCDAAKRRCTIRVTKVVKNPLNLPVTGRAITIDYYNWYADPANVEPDQIVLACGVSVFEPELTSFRGRFYANRNPGSLELRVRTHSVRDRKGRLVSPWRCEQAGATPLCKDET